MRRTVITIILILAIPALCQGSLGPDLHLQLSEPAANGQVDFHLELEQGWRAGISNRGGMDLSPAASQWGAAGYSLGGIHAGMPRSNNPAPRDMLSMMSFVWAEMFGGVDIVAEVKDFARQIRRKGRYGQLCQNQERDSRNQWKFVVAWRINDQTEVAALLKNRGHLFGDGNLALEINALDPMSEEVGVTMAYSDGDFDIRADRMTLTETASATLMVKF